MYVYILVNIYCNKKERKRGGWTWLIGEDKEEEEEIDRERQDEKRYKDNKSETDAS